MYVSQRHILDCFWNRQLRGDRQGSININDIPEIGGILVVNFQILNLRDEGPTPGWDDPAVLARPGPRARPGRFAAAVNDGAARRRLRPCPLAQL